MKKVLLFSDLEGTILRELDGKYDKEAMYNFLVQIDRLQQLTGAEVHMHLVSPINMEQMEEIIDEIDSDIARYNINHQASKRIPMIECGGFLPEKGIHESEFLGDKVIALKMPTDTMQFDTARFGKANYVKTWCSMYKEREELLMAIYCGNGKNDLSAMKYIKDNKGFVVCPSNSRTLAKQKADFVSNRTDLQGITEGIENINKKIAERVAPQSEKESAKEQQDESEQ